MRIAGTQFGNDIARYLMFRAAPPASKERSPANRPSISQFKKESRPHPRRCTICKNEDGAGTHWRLGRCSKIVPPCPTMRVSPLIPAQIAAKPASVPLSSVFHFEPSKLRALPLPRHRPRSPPLHRPHSGSAGSALPWACTDHAEPSKVQNPPVIPTAQTLFGRCPQTPRSTRFRRWEQSLPSRPFPKGGPIIPASHSAVAASPTPHAASAPRHRQRTA